MAEFQGLSEEGQNFIAKILTLETRDKWHGKAAVPPGSVLDDILTHFERHTDIPLELPFIGWMTYFSGWLCAQDVRIQIAISPWPHQVRGKPLPSITFARI
jgi:hypothetical protein